MRPPCRSPSRSATRRSAALPAWPETTGISPWWATSPTPSGHAGSWWPPETRREARRRGVARLEVERRDHARRAGCLAEQRQAEKLLSGVEQRIVIEQRP